MNAREPVSLETALARACGEIGVQTPATLPPAGKWTRTNVGERANGRNDASILVFADGVGGIAHNWQTGEERPFFVIDDRQLSPEERAERERQIDEARKKADAERERIAKDAAAKAVAIWSKATATRDDHPYLARKGVCAVETLRELDAKRIKTLAGYTPTSGGEPLQGRLLVVPVYVDGKLSTVEMIDGVKRKSALYGGVKGGGFWSVVPIPDDATVIVIAEGVATALSIWESTGWPTVSAHSAENLVKVAKALRVKYAEAVLIVAGDIGNGEEYARKAAAAVGGVVVLPDFGDDRADDCSDFNDLQQARGADEVHSQIEAATAPHANAEPADKSPRKILLIIADDAIARTMAGDAGALFEIIETLRELRAKFLPDYARVRARIRQECRRVPISELERQLRSDVNTTDEKSVADLLIELADERCELFRDPDRVAYALLDRDSHRECWPVGSEGFREWLAFAFYQQHGRAPTEQAVTTALATIEGKAKFDGDERPVHLRVASVDGAIWIDLCNNTWQAVEVTATGWRIVEAPPLHFVRTANMRALPTPVVGGNIAPLWEVANISEDDRLIVVTWMLECFRNTTPHAVLELTGEQGSAKSTTQNFLRELVDPNASNNRAAPRNVDDVFVAAKNAHMVSLENLSHLHAPYQDALCVLTTGGGRAARTLFTDGDETVFDLKKPVVLNGIAVIVTAQDLADRTVHVDLPTIENGRETEDALKKRFERARCGIFGGLLDLLARALAQLQVVETESLKLPRMADFAQLGEAVYRAHGEPAGAFLADYEERRREGVHRTLEASPVAVAMLAYLEENPSGFGGTIGRLLDVLTRYRQDTESWPKSAKGMGDAFRRLAPALRQIGITAWASEKRGMYGYACSLKRTVEANT